MRLRLGFDIQILIEQQQPAAALVAGHVQLACCLPHCYSAEGQTTQVIVVQEPGVLAGVEGMPLVKVPHHHPGVGPPCAGTGWYGGSPPVFAQVVLVAAFGVTVIVLAAAAS